MRSSKPPSLRIYSVAQRFSSTSKEYVMQPLIIALSGSLVLHWRGAVGTWLLAITSGLAAAIALMVINALSG
jgi:hypothetical protein